MTRKLVVCLALGALGSAGADAGTVYIPLLGYDSVGQKAWELVVTATNAADTPATFKQLALHAETDGTIRPPAPTAQEVPAKQTVGLIPSPTFKGLLELTGSESFSFSARLERVDGLQTTELPVLSSETAGAPGDKLYLQGLRRIGTVATDWSLVNLAWQTAECTVGATGPTGISVGSTATLSVKPLSIRTYADILQVLALTEAEYIRVVVSCNQPFFTFAMTRDQQTGDIGYIGPSGRGNSGLVLPGDTPPPPPPPPTGCPAGGACFTVPGLAFAPTTGTPVKRFTFAVPPGNYERIDFEMDVIHGGWNTANRDGKHMLFWLVKNRNYYMYGYGNFEGPGKNDVLFRHGVEITHPEKIKITAPLAAQPQHTYHLKYAYDTRQNFLKLEVSENGTLLATINGTPNTNVIDFAAGDQGIIDIGFDGSNPEEMPTYGWKYGNIKINFLK